MKSSKLLLKLLDGDAWSVSDILQGTCQSVFSLRITVIAWIIEFFLLTIDHVL